MKAYRRLLAFDHLVGYARIVRIDNEVDVRQTLDELAIVQQACNHCTVEGVLTLHQQLFHPILVLRDIRPVGVWSDLH